MGIGFTEMIIIAGIALVVLGPEKFPEFAKIAIRAIRDIRSYFEEVKVEIAKEIKPIEKELNELTRKSNELYREILTETEPSYTSKGYTPSINYIEHSYTTSTENEEEKKEESLTSEGEVEESGSYEAETGVYNEVVEPYDPDIPQADLQRTLEVAPHNDEEFHEMNEEKTPSQEERIELPERLDG